MRKLGVRIFSKAQFQQSELRAKRQKIDEFSQDRLLAHLLSTMCSNGARTDRNQREIGHVTVNCYASLFICVLFTDDTGTLYSELASLDVVRVGFCCCPCVCVCVCVYSVISKDRPMYSCDSATKHLGWWEGSPTQLEMEGGNTNQTAHSIIASTTKLFLHESTNPIRRTSGGPRGGLYTQ